MEIKFENCNRKDLLKAMGEILEIKPKYLGMPSMAYEVGYFTIAKDGAVSFDDMADSEENETLLETLAQRGFVATEKELPNDTDDEEQGDTGETVGLTVEVPLDKVCVGKLTNLLESKSNLIKKSLGIKDLSIAINEDSISFPWFADEVNADEVKAYTNFISALCKMSREQKRISNIQKEVDNEKYAFRCLLLRLGFIGDEFKAERKILLQNFSGSAAFKGKKFRVELDDDNFKIFSASTNKQAQELAWQIAKEMNSEFCELHEEAL